MALVKGPLFSIEARGKIADAMVHFPWKGRNCVRKWLKPANPRDLNQQLVRQKMAAIGKAIKVCLTVGDLPANGSALYQLIKAETPSNNIWNAFLSKTVLDEMATDSNFTTLSDAIMATDVTATWIACAAALKIDTITGDAFATTINPEIALAMAAWAAYKLDLSDATNIYSTYPSNWLVAEVSQFATNFTQIY